MSNHECPEPRCANNPALPGPYSRRFTHYGLCGKCAARFAKRFLGPKMDRVQVRDNGGRWHGAEAQR